MLTSTNRNKIPLIKVLNHYFYISLVDVKTRKIIHSTRTPFALLDRQEFRSHFLSSTDTQATDSVALTTPLTTQMKSLIFTRLMK